MESLNIKIGMSILLNSNHFLNLILLSVGSVALAACAHTLGSEERGSLVQLQGIWNGSEKKSYPGIFCAGCPNIIGEIYLGYTKTNDRIDH